MNRKLLKILKDNGLEPVESETLVARKWDKGALYFRVDDWECACGKLTRLDGDGNIEWTINFTSAPLSILESVIKAALEV